MDIISTIIPIFIIVFWGIFARHNGFLSQDFLHQANRLVYFIAIPAMIFSAIAKSSLKTQFHPGVILDRSLSILKGMALPMELLVIGASLSFEKIRLVFASVVMTSVLKLLVMPAMGLVLFKLFGISASDFIPA
nr:AEC family transporter [uncultured Desulfobacter sp.]